MAQSTRIWRVSLWIVGVIVVLVALLLGGLATQPGRNLLAGLIERNVDASRIRVAITNLGGWPPFRIGADKVVLLDRDGPFAEIDGLEAQVRVGALLRGAVVLDSVAADRVAVMRRPLVQPKDAESAASDFTLEKLALPKVELGAALLGRPATLVVAGSVATGANGSVRANVNAERSDGKRASLAMTLARGMKGAPLLIDAKLDEDADGIVSGLLGRDAGPAYTLAVRSEAAEGGAKGTVALASTGTAKFDGRFATQPKGSLRTVTIDGEGDLGELLPPDLTSWIGGPMRIAVDADVDPTSKDALPPIDVRRASLESGGLRAAATGRIAGSASNLTFKLDAGVANGAPLRIPGAPALSLQHAALEGKAVPAVGAVRIVASGAVDRFVATDVSLAHTRVTLALTSARSGLFAKGELPFTLRIAPDALESPRGVVRASANAPLALAAEGTFDTAKSRATLRATLDAAGARATYDGDAAATGARGKATLKVGDLRPLATLAKQSLAGAVDASGTIAVAANGTLTLDLDGRTVDLDPGQATAAQLLKGTTRVKGRIARNAAGDLAFTDVAIDANALQLNGSATLGATTLAANVDGQLADLSVLARDTQGALRFAVKAAGARLAPTLDATLRLDRGTLLGKPVERVAARIEGRPAAPAQGALQTGWSGKLALEGTYAGRRVDGTADATLDPRTNALAFPRIDLAVGDNRIRGALARNPKGLLDGTLDVAAPDLATLAALALVDASGAANAKLRFGGGSDGRQKLAATFAARNLKVDTVAIGTVEGDADIDDVFGTVRVRGRADAKNVAIGDFRLDTATARATVATVAGGTGGSTRFALAAKNADLDLASNATLAQSGTAKKLTIETLAGTAYKLPVKLAAPATVDIDGERVTLRNVNVALGGGTLRADGSVAPELDLTVVADKVALAVANAFKPDLRADGTVSGRATIQGTPSAFTAAWQVEGSGLRARETRRAGLPAIAVNAKGTATGADTSLEGTISGGGAMLNVKGKVPYAGNGLAVHADGSVPLALLALQSRRELRLGGSIRASVDVTGALSSPQIAGTAELVEATIADTETAFGITGATGRIVFDGKRATLEQVKGHLLQGGDVAAGGAIDIASDGLPAALTIRIDNGRFNDGRVVNTSFSGNLAINGPLLGAGTVSGSIALGRTEIQLPDRFGGGGDAIRVKHVNTKPGYRDPLARRNREADREAREGGRAAVLKLAVDLTNSGGIFVRGFGVDAEFGGQLKLAGTIDSPDAIGAFTMRRGRIELLGKRFNLTSGRLTFAGELIPLLDFQATTTAGDTSVTASVIGPAADPVITMSSSPDLPQEEILSKLLFERSVGTLSPFQAAQLIDAISRFTGVRSGSSMLDRIRQSTGLDDLDVRQNATGGTTVGVGRRLSDDIRLGVEAGSDSTAGRVTIDLDITRELKARGEAGQDGSGRVGLTYEHEY
jgi:translocation and assembly module TamB